MRRHIQRVHKKIPKTKKFWMPVLVAVLVLQSLAILYMWPKVDVTWKQTNKDPNEDIQLKMLIKDSAASVYSDAIINAETKRVYLPEINVFFPLDEKTRQLKYQYIPGDTKNSYPEEIMISTKNQVETLPETLAQVPCVQQMLRVTINNQDSERFSEKKAGSVTLDDGRGLYFFENNNKSCSSRWLSFGPTDMTQVMKTAKSY